MCWLNTFNIVKSVREMQLVYSGATETINTFECVNFFLKFDKHRVNYVGIRVSLLTVKTQSVIFLDTLCTFM